MSEQIKQARYDFHYWSDRIRSLENELDEAQRQFILASEKLDRLECVPFVREKSNV